MRFGNRRVGGDAAPTLPGALLAGLVLWIVVSAVVLGPIWLMLELLGAERATWIVDVLAGLPFGVVAGLAHLDLDGSDAGKRSAVRGVLDDTGSPESMRTQPHHWPGKTGPFSATSPERSSARSISTEDYEIYEAANPDHNEIVTSFAMFHMVPGLLRSLFCIAVLRLLWEVHVANLILVFAAFSLYDIRKWMTNAAAQRKAQNTRLVMWKAPQSGVRRS